METRYIVHRVYYTPSPCFISFYFFKSHTLTMTSTDGAFVARQFLLPVAQSALNSVDPIIYSWLSFPVPLFGLTSDKTLQREYFLVEHYDTSNGLHGLPRCCDTSVGSRGHQTWEDLSPSSLSEETCWERVNLNTCEGALGRIRMGHSCRTGHDQMAIQWSHLPSTRSCY